MTTIEIAPGQTVWDVALSQYGSVEGIAFLLSDNDFQGEFILGSVEQEGQVLRLREGVIDQSVVDYLEPRQNVTY